MALSVAVVAATRPALAAADPPDGAPAAAPTDGYVWEDDYNFGQNPLKPLWRLDLKQRYDQINGRADRVVTTARLDAVWNLGEEGEYGQLYWRNDVPFLVGSNAASIDHPNGDWEFGFGDILTQAFYILPSSATEGPSLVDGFGVGIQLEIPSASEDNLGSNQWVLAPAIGAQFNLSEDGSNVFVPIVFYGVDIGTTGNGRGQTSSVNQLRIQPTLNFVVKDVLPIDFITLYDGEQILIDTNDGDVFFPFQIMAGRKISENTVISLEYTQKLFHTGDLDPFDWKLEFRIGFFF